MSNKVLRSSKSAPHLGFQIGISVLIYVGAGIALDKWLDTMPWFTLIGTALGVASMVALIYKISKDNQRQQAINEQEMKAEGKEYGKVEEEWPEDDWDKDDWDRKEVEEDDWGKAE